jgi:acetyl esterase/lipase
LQVPQIDDVYLTEPRENFTDLEWNSFGAITGEFYQMLGGPEWESNPYVFTSNMPRETMEKVPPTVIYTAEFDYFRQMAERSRVKYEEAGTLLDYGMLKGSNHDSYFFPGMLRTEAYYTAFNPLIENFF